MDIKELVAAIEAATRHGNRVKVVEVGPKDYVIMKAMNMLRDMENKLEPLLLLREALLDTIQGIVFTEDEQNAEYTITVDEQHSVIFRVKDGDFAFEATCDCDHPDHKDMH
jgi:hypothetical protein